jgi:hypothetical protein
VELTEHDYEADEDCFIIFGAVQPGLDHDKYYICTADEAATGNDDEVKEQGKIFLGDRIGALLDLDAGWLRFYRNGRRCGPGITEGVTGPLVRAVVVGRWANRATVKGGGVVGTKQQAYDYLVGLLCVFCFNIIQGPESQAT